MGPQNRQLVFLGPKFTKFLNLQSSCRNFGLWLPELCSKVLNPETVSATDLAQSHYLLVLPLQMCFEIYLFIFDRALPQLKKSSSFCILYSQNAVIKFRRPQSCNRVHDLMIVAPKPHDKSSEAPQFNTLATGGDCTVCNV